VLPNIADGNGYGFPTFFDSLFSPSPVAQKPAPIFQGGPVMQPPIFQGGPLPPTMQPGAIFQPTKTDCGTCGTPDTSVHDQIVQAAGTGGAAAIATDCQVCYGTFCAKCFLFWAFALVFVLIAWTRR
jgi:hypothetical protein